MKFVKSLEFDQNAIEDLSYWVKKDRRKAEKILELVQEVAKTPFTGTGKPERLKHKNGNVWSRRIDSKNRLIYSVEENIVTVEIISAKGHYGDK